MIDIVFLLLIFFMCAMRFKQIEMKLDAHLPVCGPCPGPLCDIIDELVIFVKDDRDMRRSSDFNLRTCRQATYFLGSRDAVPVTDMSVLLPTLVRLSQNRNLSILIAPYDESAGRDQLVPFFNIVRLVDACKAAGLANIRFRAPASRGGADAGRQF
jgi:biopolymer transport protein ExbD